MTEHDPRFAALRAALQGRAPFRGAPDPALSQAAVLLMVRPTEPLELMLIQRAEKEGDPWSGHMALPGGRREPRDEDLLATALRETEEEVGVTVPHGRILGALDEIRPSSRSFAITVAPYVAAVPIDTAAVPAPAEVEAAVWMPLPHMANDEAVDHVLIELEEESFSLPALNYQEYVIWGLTHRILTDFMAVAREAGLA